MKFFTRPNNMNAGFKVKNHKRNLMRKLNNAEQEANVNLKSHLNIWDDYTSEMPKKKKEYAPIKNNEDKFVLRSEKQQNFIPSNSSVIELTKDTEEKFRLNDNIKTEKLADVSWIDEIEGKINYKFKNRTLLNTAFTHSSALKDAGRADYERLEFLGDAVLDLVVAQLLCENHKNEQEGGLSKMRAALVNTLTLSEIAKRLELGKFIKMGRSEVVSGSGFRPSILADIMEATFGAIFMDSDYQAVFNVIKEMFGDSVRNVVPSDPKTELQEVLHANGSNAPQYLLKCVEGPEHSPNFVTIVVADGEVVGFGNGATKKASQQSAAAFALQRIVKNAPAVELQAGQTEIIESLLNCAVQQSGEVKQVSAVGKHAGRKSRLERDWQE